MADRVRVATFAAMFPELTLEEIRSVIVFASSAGINDLDVVEELITSVDLQEATQARRISTEDTQAPSRVAIKPEPGTTDDPESTAAIEMVTLEPASLFIDLTLEDDESGQKQEDMEVFLKRSEQEQADYELALKLFKEQEQEDEDRRQSSHKRPLQLDLVDAPEKRAKLQSAELDQQLHEIRRARQEAWKSTPHSRQAPAAGPGTTHYDPSFYSQLASARNSHRSKWHKSVGALKRTWTIHDLEQAERENHRAAIDNAGGPVPTKPRFGSLTQDPAQLGLKCLELTNKFRSSEKLPPLKWNQALHVVGLVHSKDMGDGRVPFSHQGFDGRMKAVPFRVRSFAENVAWNAGFSDPATTAVNGWIQSPGHRKNMVGRFVYCAIAVYQNAKGAWYFTQLFATG